MERELSLGCQTKLRQYAAFLHEEERSVNTIQKYLRDVRKFFCYIVPDAIGSEDVLHAVVEDEHKRADINIDVELQALKKMQVLAFKELLVANYAPASVNSMLAAVNHFLSWSGLFSCRVKPVKIQRDIFCSEAKELSEREYHRLLATAKRSGEEKISLVIQTICATGIRVSELAYITVQALYKERALVCCKGKSRIVFLPKLLCSRLKEFCKQERISKGMIFCTKNGKPLDRSNIWKMMKRLCKQARVKAEKVFPHNLRHLFARTYYKRQHRKKTAWCLGNGLL